MSDRGTPYDRIAGSSDWPAEPDSEMSVEHEMAVAVGVALMVQQGVPRDRAECAMRTDLDCLAIGVALLPPLQKAVRALAAVFGNAPRSQG